MRAVHSCNMVSKNVTAMVTVHLPRLQDQERHTQIESQRSGCTRDFIHSIKAPYYSNYMFSLGISSHLISFV